MVIFKWVLNLLKRLIYYIIKDKKVCLRRVWIRLTTAYLLCAREFRQNNALALQFWCLSNALTLRVCALDASKSQRACIILSKFTRKSKYTVINLWLITCVIARSNPRRLLPIWREKLRGHYHVTMTSDNDFCVWRWHYRKRHSRVSVNAQTITHPVFAHLSHRAMIVRSGLTEIRLQGWVQKW